MTKNDLFASFDEKQIEKYKKESEKRWSNTDAYKQSVDRTKHWTKKDYQRVVKEGEAITQQIADVMDKGAKSTTVQTLIAKHHAHIGQFYEISKMMYKNLGNMYVEDARFTAYYEKFKPGLAKFMQEAISFYCDR